MNKIDYPFVKKLLLNKKNIVITTHKTPDGDALGSSLALWHTLKKNHNVHIIVPNEYPDNLKWLPGNNNVIIYENNKSFADNIITQSDIIFCLDFNKLYRVDTMFDVVANHKCYKIMIDHHEDPDNFCDQVLSNPFISSTAELLYTFLFSLDYKLNKNSATCIYTGIVTDTGSMRYPNVTRHTHLIISELFNFKINHSSIHQNLFDTQNKSRLSLLKVCLENLKLFTNHKAALTFLREKDLIDNSYQKGDTEGFVNMPLSLKNIEFSTLFIEFKDGIKISFRSQGEFNVNLFSQKYFNGGGHKNAAGGFLNTKNIEESIEYFSIVLQKFINEKA
ncbi:MAG: DHH family phosphoesterase [Flavobacteriales bacterium]|nr:DHH family phosphoesterase [Flavobacteriales bacterium]|tara:strand:+ start:258 stop:1259 length:1002 start_codon:yes stop_codon:yes gene_type:complete